MKISILRLNALTGTIKGELLEEKINNYIRLSLEEK